MSATHSGVFEMIGLLLPLSGIATVGLAAIIAGFFWLHHDPHAIVARFSDGTSLHVDQVLGWAGIISLCASAIGIIGLTIAVLLHA